MIIEIFLWILLGVKLSKKVVKIQKCIVTYKNLKKINIHHI